MDNYDLVFLGGGPAGYEGAIHAAKRGLKTAVVEKEELGGTCLQWGCIPTKFLLNFVKSIKMIQKSKKIGLGVDDYTIDLDKMLKKKMLVISKLTKGIHLLFTNHGVKLYKGIGKIIDQNTISINDEEKIKAKRIVIATGSKPAELPFLKFDQKYIMSSNDALAMKKIPAKLLVIGGGAIGLEMALIYKYLGSEVMVVEIMDQILPGSDREIVQILEGELKKQKIKIYTSTKIVKFQEQPGKDIISFTFNKGEDTSFEVDFSSVLLSVGRKPETSKLWGDSVKIETDERGNIKVDDNLLTNEEGIFACGDVIGGALLAHKASHQAKEIVDFITHNKPIQHKPIPAAVFTFPELASIGITEERAVEDKIEYKVGRFPYSAGSRSNAVDAKSGMVKIIANKDNVLIGGHIVGEEAGELIQTINLAINKKMKADDFVDLITIHPTLSENVFEAIGELGGFSIHI